MNFVSDYLAALRENEDENYVELAIYSIIGGISMLLSLAVGITYVFSKQIRAHPAKIIVMICFCECIACYHLIIWNLNPISVIQNLGFDKLASYLDFGM